MSEKDDGKYYPPDWDTPFVELSDEFEPRGLAALPLRDRQVIYGMALLTVALITTACIQQEPRNVVAKSGAMTSRDANIVQMIMVEKEKESIQRSSVLDLSHIKDRAEVESLMQARYFSNENDPKKIEYSADYNTREVELYISKKAYDRLNSEFGGTVDWLNEHAEYLNEELRKNNLPIGVYMSTIVIVDDEVSDALHNDVTFWNLRDTYPNDLTTRFVLGSDYDPTQWIESGRHLDNALMHELGHYALLLWDLYFNDLSKGKIEYPDSLSGVPEELRYVYGDGNLLMYAQQGDPRLSEFDAFALDRMYELEIYTWDKAYDWWVGKDQGHGAYDDIKDVRIILPVDGKVEVFEAIPIETSDIFNIHKRFDDEPVLSTVTNEGSFILEYEIGSGYSRREVRDDSLEGRSNLMAWGRNFITRITSPSGVQYYYHINSNQLLLASWQTDADIADLNVNSPEYQIYHTNS